MKDNDIIPNIGNYKKLLTYQKAVIIYDITFYFCNNFLKKGDRTIDQMIQAARSGKQNIVEGCSAAPTSAKTEIKLISVAKASLKELLEDYEDYLRVRGFEQWKDGSIEKETMRRIGRECNDYTFYMNKIRSSPSATIANMAIVLLYQEDYMLFKQLKRLEEDFKKNGGFSERLYWARKR
ncbi:MAG: four helix bundle suffix domain-containing protein [Bacteroidales bacterium]|nr:four helix bundle suffix domain-containing protein [Bacteroidales bacterium]